MTTALHDLTEALRASQDIVLILHVSPDGDTCGSALALRRALVSMGKRVDVACEQGVPRIYRDLDGADAVRGPEAFPGGRAHDLAVAVDVGDRGRLGACAALFDAARDTAQIDHHETNPGYARVNLIRTPLSATGVLAGEVIEALGMPLDRETAKCLFVAVTTDTGNFKQRNTDADALRLAARCVETGIDVAAITRRVFDLRPLCQSLLIGRALCGMETLCEGRVALMSLSARDFADCGALAEHTEGIINFAINTEGVRIACLLSERDGMIKGSLRSAPPVDVSAVAGALGGGGHAQAAGFTLTCPLDEAGARLRAALAEALERCG